MPGDGGVPNERIKFYSHIELIRAWENAGLMLRPNAEPHPSIFGFTSDLDIFYLVTQIGFENFEYFVGVLATTLTGIPLFPDVEGERVMLIQQKAATWIKSDPLITACANHELQSCLEVRLARKGEL